jgi:hypothetical protein
MPDIVPLAGAAIHSGIPVPAVWHQSKKAGRYAANAAGSFMLPALTAAGQLLYRKNASNAAGH